MKKILFSINVLIVLLSISSYAGNRSEQEAIDAAQQFYKQRFLSPNSLGGDVASNALALSYKAVATNGGNYYYAFNRNGGGFVIVSGDDRTDAVIGYADEGSFDVNTIPDGMKDLLDSYKNQIDNIDVSGLSNYNVTEHKAIEPLVKTKWNQSAPYNMYVPGGYPTGCVPTAMAQVMNYYRWPEGEIQVDEDGFQGLSFDWNKMQNTYYGSDASESAQEVAKLMLWCGTAVRVGYNSSGSGADPAEVPGALSYYFNYNSDMRQIDRDVYSATEWDNIIYNELANQRVVYYDATNGTGHAFICDGYDGNGLYHINWGWGGSSDGFFKLSILDGRFSFGQRAIINIKKSSTSQNVRKLKLLKFTPRGSSTDNRDIGYTISFGESMSKTGGREYTVGLYDKDRLIAYCKNTLDHPINSEWTIWVCYATIPENLPNGRYQLKALYREEGATEWTMPLAGEVNYISMVKDGQTITLDEVTQGNMPWGKCQVNDINVEGNLETFSEQKVNIKLKNVGETEQVRLTYICYYDGNSVKSGYVGATIDPQTSEETYFTFTPTMGGEYTVVLLDNGEVVKEYSFNISEAPITLTAVNTRRIYGESNPEFYYTQDKYDMAIKGAPALTCDATQESPVGTYPIVISKGTMDYSNLKFVNGTLTILKAILEITPKSYTIMEGDPLPDFEINYSGFKNGETEGVLLKKPKAFVNINSSSKPGTYTIYLKDIEAENYSFDLRYGQLTIQEAPNYTTEIDGVYYNINLYSKEAKVISHPDGYAGEIVIRENVTYNGETYPVTSIVEKAFYNCTELTKVSIGKNVSSLGNYAFYGCNGLEDVFCYAEKIPEGGYNLFSRRYNLYVSASSLNQYRSTYPWSDFTNVRALPDENVKTVEIDGIYYEINTATKEASVTSNPNKYRGVITIPSTVSYEGEIYMVTAIGYRAFDGSYPEKVMMPNSIKSIDWYAFNHCYKLSSIDIPTSVESIGKLAFNDCSSLATITIPANTKCIGEYAFAWCSNLKYVKVEDGVREIGNDSFFGCEKLESIALPQNMDKIGSYVFSGCSSLKSVKISEGIKKIEPYCFRSCGNLVSVTIPSSANEVNGTMFNDCANLTAIYCYAETVPTFDNPTLYIPFENTPVEQITLYVHRDVIDDYKQDKYWNTFGNIAALEDITALESVASTVPASVFGKIYSIDGKQLSQPQKGLNILKMSDGTTRKVVK